jgi:hypothetical protein
MSTEEHARHCGMGKPPPSTKAAGAARFAPMTLHRPARIACETSGLAVRGNRPVIETIKFPGHDIAKVRSNVGIHMWQAAKS